MRTQQEAATYYMFMPKPDISLFLFPETKTLAREGRVVAAAVVTAAGLFAGCCCGRSTLSNAAVIGIIFIFPFVWQLNFYGENTGSGVFGRFRLWKWTEKGSVHTSIHNLVDSVIPQNLAPVL